MLLRLLDNTALRALTGGVLYALLAILANWAADLAEEWVAARSGSSARHTAQVTTWDLPRRTIAAILGIAFSYALLLEGTFASNDIGIAPLHWQVHGSWLAVLLAGTIGLLILFWAPQWRKRNGPEVSTTRVRQSHGWLGGFLDALREEASLTMFRASSIPLLGAYWGVWLGLAWNLGLRRIIRPLRANTASADDRGFHYLADALDWLSATLFVITGSLWACLLGRLLCHGAAQIIFGWSIKHRAALLAPTPSGQNDSQDDQDGKHDGGQDGDAPQIT